MGSCISQGPVNGSRRPTNYTNPIKMTVSSKSIELLRAKWDREQLQLLQGKVSTLVGTSLPFQRFLQVFPKLSGLCPTTQRKYFKLLAYQGNPEISRKELMNALTIIKKVEDSRFLAPLIYYVYTERPSQPAMTQSEFQFFQEENKAYANNLQNFDIDLEEQIVLEEQEISISQREQKRDGNNHNEHQNANGNNANGNSKPKPSNQLIPPQTNPSLANISSNGSAPINRKRVITPAQFQKIFASYNLQHYQILFSWSLPEEQRQLVAVFLRQGMSRKKGDKVFLIQYKWFLSWKAYAQQQYNARIDLRDLELELNYLSTKSANRRKSKDEGRLDPPNSHRMERVQKPGQIKNFILKYGRKDNELVENMRQLHNYICVKEEVWRRMVAIYNGGPAIERIYPKIYYNVIVKVTVQHNGKFLLKSSRKIQSKQRPTVSGYAQPSELAHACFYKYPGKKNWKQLYNISTNSQQIFNSPRTYLAFVPRQAVSTFIALYNIRQSRQQKLLRQRFANYGTEVNFSIDGVMNRAQVVQIEDARTVTVEYIDEQGNVRRKTITHDDDFQKFNPENLLEESQLNELSGLDNIGNTCYMNAVIQCLIRTPFFGNYLQQENFGDSKDEQLLVEEIAKIYVKSKTNSHASINTKHFKKVFEKHCPYFEGNSQHDAQEFLLCLLQRLMEEIKNKRQQFGVKSQVRRSGPQDKNANKKVVKFFSGKTEAITTCRKCKNKGVRLQSFFTYSISLPQQPVIQFYYHYVPLYKSQANHSLTPLLCGITLNRKATVENFITQVSKQRNIKNRKLALFTVFNNEILNKLESSSFYKEIGYYLHFNAKLVCYQVEHEDAPTFYDYQKRQISGKSVKIQLRQRIYSEKNQEYKAIYQPFILEITQRMFWKDVEQDIKLIMQKLQPKEVEILQTPNPSHMVQPDKSLGLSEIKLSASSIKHTPSLNDSPYNFNKNNRSVIRNTLNGSPATSSNVNGLSSSASQQYKIHVIKTDHIYENSCYFCKEDFIHSKRSFSKRICKGCTFDKSTLLLQQAQFRNICDNIIITVDWQQTIPEFQKFTKDQSYDFCLQLAQSRKDVLKDLLYNNFNNVQQLQLRCEKQGCQYDFASRTEVIKTYPNILLLHLKRFTYQDNMLVKLTNSVIYPQTLQLPSQSYQLYGVVCHMGSGAGGHYISFVKVAGKWYKCDDSRVRLASSGQHIDPNAYLLFYKRKEFEPGLMTLSF